MSARALTRADTHVSLPNCPPSEEIIRQLREESDSIILAFSNGKDALGAWLALREAGFTIYPFYRWLAPNLEFIEVSLRYYEAFFGVPIVRVPHPGVFRMIRHFVFQPPERCFAIEEADLPNLDYERQVQHLRQHWGLPDTTWVATGVRCSDSIQRRTHFLKHGALTHRKRTAYPIWDWRKNYLLSQMRRSGMKVPSDYAMFGRSFDGIDWRFLDPVRRNYPDDYKRILEWYPLAELEILRYDMHQTERR